MNINGFNSGPTTTYQTKEKRAKEVAADKTESEVIYESSKASSKNEGVIYKPDDSPKSNKALISKFKADAEARTSQLRSIVEKMMSQQGSAIGKADDIWAFLAKGDFTVDAATRTQAQADIAEDGYWGVTQTSDRMFDFAKALAGGDPAKMEEMKDAFLKGFKQATATWGGKLPDTSQRTYEATLAKFDSWATENDSSSSDDAVI